MVGRNLLSHASAKDWDILYPSSKQLDLMDGPAVAAYISKHKPDIVVHAAGRVGGIKANMADPVAFLDQNLMLGRNVILGARNAGVKHLLNLGSTCIYPHDVPNPLKEEMILTGQLEPTNEGYALAKLVALRLCMYIRQEDPSFVYKTLIPCNLYGMYDKFDPNGSHLIPAIIRKVYEAEKAGHDTIEIWGDGTARREFMYAGDLVDAIYKAANSIETIPDLMNVGVGSDHSVNDYYAAVAGIVGWNGTFVHDLSKPVGMKQKLCDTGRQTAWGWQPETSLAVGISKTYKHFLEMT